MVVYVDDFLFFFFVISGLIFLFNNIFGDDVVGVGVLMDFLCCKCMKEFECEWIFSFNMFFIIFWSWFDECLFWDCFVDEFCIWILEIDELFCCGLFKFELGFFFVIYDGYELLRIELFLLVMLKMLLFLEIGDLLMMEELIGVFGIGGKMEDEEEYILDDFVDRFLVEGEDGEGCICFFGKDNWSWF